MNHNSSKYKEDAFGSNISMSLGDNESQLMSLGSNYIKREENIQPYANV